MKKILALFCICSLFQLQSRELGAQPQKTKEAAESSDLLAKQQQTVSDQKNKNTKPEEKEKRSKRKKRRRKRRKKKLLRGLLSSCMAVLDVLIHRNTIKKVVQMFRGLPEGAESLDSQRTIVDDYSNLMLYAIKLLKEENRLEAAIGYLARFAQLTSSEEQTTFVLEMLMSEQETACLHDILLSVYYCLPDINEDQQKTETTLISLPNHTRESVASHT